MGWERGRVVVFIMGKVGALEQMRPGRRRRLGRKTEGADVGFQGRSESLSRRRKKGGPRMGKITVL